jgi:Raf kinase inhibitor-like YbhB/YbcL family protein
MKSIWMPIIAIASLISFNTPAFQLTSKDIQEGQRMGKAFEYQGFGCNGQNLSPALHWTSPPKGTKSFAITAYDPDAPTGSGWWHWRVIDIPATVRSIKRGAQLDKLGAITLKNDYGETAFGGACPPVGDSMHRYQFTLWALPVDKLKIDTKASAALMGFMLNSMALDKATLTATYVR